MNRIEGLRLVAGFIFAPAIGVLVLLLAMATKSAIAPATNENFEGMAIFGLAVAYVAYSAAFIVGLPLFILLYARRWFRLWQIAVGGLLVGASIALLLNAYDVFGLMFCVVGLSTGVAFWLIVIFRNRALTPGFRSDAPKTAHV